MEKILKSMSIDDLRINLNLYNEEIRKTNQSYRLEMLESRKKVYQKELSKRMDEKGIISKRIFSY